LDHGSQPEWRGEIHAVLIAFAALEAARIGSMERRNLSAEEGRRYLSRRAAHAYRQQQQAAGWARYSIPKRISRSGYGSKAWDGFTEISV
jgi:hypothetical protein